MTAEAVVTQLSAQPLEAWGVKEVTSDDATKRGDDK